jgi:Helix-turn-helix domain
MSIHSTGLGDDERLVVRPKLACLMLDVGVTRLYELIKAGELESFKDGGARKITMRSIRARVDRLLKQAKAA